MTSKFEQFRDFRKFALDKTRVNASSFDSYTQDFLTPYILEERRLNVTQMDVFSRLMYDRIIFLSGMVERESMDIVVAQLLYLDSVDNRDINIYVNSPGGDCYSGLELVSVMDFINSKVGTTVLGMAASMGAVIASNGEKGKRNVLPYSRIMIHQPSSDFGYARFTDTKIAFEEMEATRNDIYDVLWKNSKVESKDKIIELCERGDRWIKPQEAIELGFADSIVQKK